MNGRWSIRQKRAQNQPPPWTDDPLLANYRFCNVHREDDRVTRWVKHHIRDPYPQHNLWHRLMMARMLNWPPTLEALYDAFGNYAYPWDWQDVLQFLEARKEAGEKVFGSAYIVSTNGLKLPKDRYVCGLWKEAYSVPVVIGPSLATTHKSLTQVRGLASFMAAQIVADLKHTPLLENAPDHGVWCAPGPGSMRGLNRVRGNAPDHRTWNQRDFMNAVNELQMAVDMNSMFEFIPPVDAQDLQNCLCEFDKYKRLQEGGQVRATYTPHEYPAPALQRP